MAGELKGTGTFLGEAGVAQRCSSSHCLRFFCRLGGLNSADCVCGKFSFSISQCIWWFLFKSLCFRRKRKHNIALNMRKRATQIIEITRDIVIIQHHRAVWKSWNFPSLRRQNSPSRCPDALTLTQRTDCCVGDFNILSSIPELRSMSISEYLEDK